MKIGYRFYNVKDDKVKKTINIDDDLYEKLIYLTKNKYDTSLSGIINVAVEYYTTVWDSHEKLAKRGKSVTYRTIDLRKSNVDWLLDKRKETSISITRLVNEAIARFIDAVREEEENDMKQQKKDR